MNKVTLEVTKLLRRDNSIYGNPNYELVGYEDGRRSSYRTKSDIQASYGVIPNKLSKATEEKPITVELLLTRSNRIKYVTLV